MVLGLHVEALFELSLEGLGMEKKELTGEYEREWRKCMKANPTMRYWSEENQAEWSALPLSLAQPLFPSDEELNFYWPRRVAVDCNGSLAWEGAGMSILGSRKAKAFYCIPANL